MHSMLGLLDTTIRFRMVTVWLAGGVLYKFFGLVLVLVDNKIMSFSCLFLHVYQY